MESPDPAALEMGWTELLAGTVATLFAVVSALGLLTVLVTSPRAADTRLKVDGAAAYPPAPAADGCASGPVLGGMRLGTPRMYRQAGIRLEPVPLSVSPAIPAQEAYRKAALKPPGCQTELILAYYSVADPTAQGVLAWAVVSTSACGSRRCISVAAVDATTGRALAPGVFADALGR